MREIDLTNFQFVTSLPARKINLRLVLEISHTQSSPEGYFWSRRESLWVTAELRRRQTSP
jgi:hypothetical protein